MTAKRDAADLAVEERVGDRVRDLVAQLRRANGVGEHQDVQRVTSWRRSRSAALACGETWRAVGVVQPAGGRRGRRRAGAAAALRPCSGRTRYGQRGWKRQPRRRAAPGREPRRAAPPAGARRRRRAGSRRSAPRCTGAAGAARAAPVGAVSTIRPRYMTAIASATCCTIARSCEISSSADLELPRQLDEQVRDLRLRRRVERRQRLVEHDHRRLGRERPGDRDPLALAAAELVRVAVGRAGRQADQVEQLGDPRPLLARCRATRRSRSAVGELRADRAARVQRRVRVLEDHLQAHGSRGRARRVERRHRRALEDDRARARRHQADDRAGERRLAAAGLADEADDLARARRRGSTPATARTGRAARAGRRPRRRGARAGSPRRSPRTDRRDRRASPRRRCATSGGTSVAQALDRRSAQRGWNAQPDGLRPATAARPGSGRAARLRRLRAAAAREQRPRVRDGAARWSTSRASAPTRRPGRRT